MKAASKAAFAAVSACVALGAAGFCAMRAHQFRERDIPVLMYHNVVDDPRGVWQVATEEFRRQMDDLAAAGYTPILPDDIARAAKGWGWLPRKPVVITFDDGYLGNMENAEPILREHGFKAICYAIVCRLATNGQERAEFDSGPLLTCQEAAAMDRRGTIRVGVHSKWHRPDPNELAADSRDGRHELRRRTGIKTRSYCYPYGMCGPALEQAVRDGRYATALACRDRMFHYSPTNNLFQIPRLSVYGGAHDIRIVSADPASGKVTLANDGSSLPLRVSIRDAETGEEIDAGTARVGAKPVTFESARPFPEGSEITATDACGLFRYL